MRVISCDYFVYKRESYSPGMTFDADIEDIQALVRARRIADIKYKEPIETAAVEPPERQARGRPPGRIKT